MGKKKQRGGGRGKKKEQVDGTPLTMDDDEQKKKGNASGPTSGPSSLAQLRQSLDLFSLLNGGGLTSASDLSQESPADFMASLPALSRALGRTSDPSSTSTSDPFLAMLMSKIAQKDGAPLTPLLSAHSAAKGSSSQDDSKSVDRDEKDQQKDEVFLRLSATPGIEELMVPDTAPILFPEEDNPGLRLLADNFIDTDEDTNDEDSDDEDQGHAGLLVPHKVQVEPAEGGRNSLGNEDDVSDDKDEGTASLRQQDASSSSAETSSLSGEVARMEEAMHDILLREIGLTPTSIDTLPDMPAEMQFIVPPPRQQQAVHFYDSDESDESSDERDGIERKTKEQEGGEHDALVAQGMQLVTGVDSSSIDSIDDDDDDDDDEEEEVEEGASLQRNDEGPGFHVPDGFVLVDDDGREIRSDHTAVQEVSKRYLSYSSRFANESKGDAVATAVSSCTPVQDVDKVADANAEEEVCSQCEV